MRPLFGIEINTMSGISEGDSLNDSIQWQVYLKSS